MKFSHLWCMILGASLHAFCQSTADGKAPPALPSDPRAFFELAVPHYDFSEQRLKPWHLKARYEIYNYAGELTTKGTWEYWWISPRERKRSWERSGASRTDWVTKDCTVYRKESGEPPDFFETLMEDLILYPGPNYEAIKSKYLKLSLKSPEDGSKSPTCLVTTPVLGTSVNYLSTPSDYCFDPGTMAIVASYSTAILRQYSDFIVMQGLYIARHITEQIDAQAKLVVDVDAVEGVADTDAVLARPQDAVLLPWHAHYTSDSKAFDNLKRTKPLSTPLPMKAEAGGQPGIVDLVAKIGVDGKVRAVQVLSATSSHHAEVASETVMRWKFQPEMANGKPIDTEFPFRMTF